MKKLIYRTCLALGALSLGIPASAQLKYGTDYTTSDAVWSVTPVKVDSNMIPDYLEGVKQTWTSSNDVAKQLGQIEDYSVFTSELAAGGDYNVMLMVKYANMAQYEKAGSRFPGGSVSPRFRGDPVLGFLFEKHPMSHVAAEPTHPGKP